MTVPGPRPTVSVCLPARHRPDMIQETISSCWAQTVLPDEIVIGDDSEDDRTEIQIARLRASSPVPLVYQRNTTPLGPSLNVQRIFERATSDWLLLIHDDDWLLPEAISALTDPISRGESVDAVFGMQFQASSDGVIDEAGAEALNRTFHRTSEHIGLQPDPLRSAVLQQFPNIGFLVRRSLALEVGYHHDPIRDGCDYAFGLRLAAAGARFWLVGSFTSVYRLSASSITRGPQSAASCIMDMAAVTRPFLDDLDPQDVAVRDKVHADLYRAVVWCGLKRTRRLEVLRWALNSRWGLRWWPQGLSALAALVAPGTRTEVKRLLGEKDAR